MYAASQAFHNAVRNGNHQMPLLIFRDAVFTERDIDVDTGIEFDDNFNMEEDLAIGQATSNEIRFTLFNDERLLNNYEFGEFKATIGVHVSTGTYRQYGTAMVIVGNNQYVADSRRPYLVRNGTALAAQPSFRVASLLAYNGKIWAFGANGEYEVYNDATGANITGQNPVNSFMRNKSKAWNGYGYWMRDNYLTIYWAGKSLLYEFVPLGTFDAERPKVPDQIRISMTCYDRMTKFDSDMPTAEQLGITYPCTIGQLFVKLCQKVDVSYSTASFINSGAEIEKEPEEFSNCTMRQVLMWIAEAAGSNARFNRDGLLKLDWVHTGTGQSYSEGDYVAFEPTWYETERVGQIYNRTTADGKDIIYGQGTPYLIQDNPLLRGAGEE